MKDVIRIATHIMNELLRIFARLNIDTDEVLKIAGTKRNFHHYRSGMVGSHCIPVDPYYLVQKAKEVGYHPQVITCAPLFFRYTMKRPSTFPAAL